MQCGLCCLPNLAVGLLPALNLEVTGVFLLSRGLEFKGSFKLLSCCRAGSARPENRADERHGAASVCLSALLPLALDIRENIPTPVTLIEYLLLS